MERTKRNRRFLGIVLINSVIFVFAAVHAPIFISVPCISPRIYLRFSAVFVYSLVYAFIALGINIRRSIPNKLTRKVVSLRK